MPIDNLEIVKEMYFIKFGESFPTFEAPQDEEEQFVRIKRCLAEGKSHAELYNVDYDKDIKY